MIISQHYLTFPFYFPRIIHQIDNWPSYVANYMLRRERPTEYRFRMGCRLIDGTGTVAGTIAVVFVRREYGLLKNCRVIVDIGSNMGAFAIYAALSCPHARIYCFEPEERNFSFLRTNISINSLEGRVMVHQLAVASTSGERAMAVTTSPLNSLVIEEAGGCRAIVRCVTLPDVLAGVESDRVDVLKMNCEGAEYEILESAREADFERIPDIRLEYHNLNPPGRNGRSLAKLLQGRGYRIRRFTDYKNVSGFIWAVRGQPPCTARQPQSAKDVAADTQG